MAKTKGPYVATQHLCHDRVGQGPEFLCRDRVFLCHDKELAKGRIFLWRLSILMSRQRVGQGKDSLVTIEHFYVATKLANAKRIPIAIEYISCRDREFQNMGFPCHDIVLYVTTVPRPRQSWACRG